MRIACVQANVAFASPSENVASAVEHLEKLKSEGVDLAVFPEAFLTGYCVSTLVDALRIAIEPRALAPLAEACERLSISLAVGFAERSGHQVFNTAALFEPGKEVRYYRKVHLPELGLDKFVIPGDDLPVFDTAFGRLGILICFDLRVPEAARVLALKGVELIVLPTNWPEGAEASAEHLVIARAAENRVFLVACNRVGEENGFRFIGRSKIVAPSGQVIAAAGTGEEVIVADIDLADARVKRNVIIPGKFETTVFDCRRPELYGEIAGISRTDERLPAEPAPLWV